jgi:predicted unusual protein kinase regulating ubiquinone biosynthesis (AarF/ABC1/UbiB family)
MLQVLTAALSKRGAQIFLKMVFEDGFFHADLHPGIFIEEGGILD